MNVLLGYAYDPKTTGVYFERSFRKRHNVFYCGTSWGARPGFRPDADISQIVPFLPEKPDVFIWIEVNGPFRFWPRGLENLPFPTACYLIDVHTGGTRGLKLRRRMAKFFDYVFIAQKDYLEEFKQDGNESVFWLPLACDADVHKRHNLEKIYDVAFVGQIGSGFFSKRTYLLERLSQKYRLNDYHKHYPPAEMAKIYSQAKIVFNCPVGGDLNMRVFEALSSGSLLVTEKIKNGQAELFKDGEHLVTYTDEQSLMRTVEYYLQNDAERERIANAGYELVTQEHTYDKRAEQILRTVVEGGGAMNAVMRNTNPVQRHLDYMEIYSGIGMLEAAVDEFFRITSLSPLYLPAYLSLAKALAKRIKSGRAVLKNRADFVETWIQEIANGRYSNYQEFSSTFGDVFADGN